MKYVNGQRNVSRRDFMRLGGRAAAAVAAGSLVAGCELLDPRDDDRYLVEITNQARFDPADLTIPVGSTVVWRNMDEIRHTATGDPDALGDPFRVQLPDGAEPWDSGDLTTGERWTHTFSVPGTYVYACRYHQEHGMVGTVTVEPEGTGEDEED